MKSAIRLACIYIAAGVGLIALCIAISTLVVRVVDKCQPQPPSNIITKEVKTDEVKTLQSGQVRFRGKVLVDEPSIINAEIRKRAELSEGCCSTEWKPSKVLLIGGKIKSASGHISASDSIELLDLNAHTSKVLGTLRFPREDASIKRISADEFLILGGYNNHAWKTDTTPRPPELLDLTEIR